MDITISENKPVSYKVNKEYKLVDLMDSVNNDIRCGWTPLGGIQIVNNNPNLTFYQAMVLNSKS